MVPRFRRLMVGGQLLCLLSQTTFLTAGCVRPGEEESYESRRQGMVRRQLAARDIKDKAVLEAMRQVPRHLFVPGDMRPHAYQDSPLPIGFGQTISQPYIVALMTQMVRPRPTDRVLEVGTGSGYQAAVISRIVERVFSVEIVPELADRARATLQELGYDNVAVRQGDGYKGWPQEAPFDIILVTAAAPKIPQPLLDQLAEGGRMAIPVGNSQTFQVLSLLEKKGGEIHRSSVLDVRFVPMTGRIRSP